MVVVVGIILPLLLLQWSNGGSFNAAPVLVFYEEPLGRLRGFRYGIYNADGVPYLVSVLLGIVLPLCLFATAAFIALGRRKN
jgi:hypothetical protein